MKVLFADDDPGCQTLLRDLLADRPEVVITVAANGAEAWWHLSDTEARFNLLITDLSMPVVSGLELLHRIRLTPRLLYLPVIVCSGLKDRTVVQEAASLNPTSYLLKPFMPRMFRDKIDALLLQSSGR